MFTVHYHNPKLFYFTLFSHFMHTSCKSCKHASINNQKFSLRFKQDGINITGHANLDYEQ